MGERERFEKWLQDNWNQYGDFSFERNDGGGYIDPGTNDMWLGWQAALSTRKTYGYGIVDKDGLQEPTSVTYVDKESLENIVHLWNKRGSPTGPFRVVKLFYEDQS